MNTRSIEVMHGYSSIGSKNGTATMSQMVSCPRKTHITLNSNFTQKTFNLLGKVWRMIERCATNDARIVKQRRRPTSRNAVQFLTRKAK